jgi:CDP-diacylglycerol--serine O-phosphatidyltransferase
MGDLRDLEEAKPEEGAPQGDELQRARGLGALRRRGIYLLPNLFTTAALFCGFYAIVQAMNARFEVAAIAIYVAMVLDGLDGRVARLTHTTSEFGAQYDSLSDMVCFGAAPALVVYEWALKDMGKAGWIAAFVYCAGAALRLARFNVNLDVVDKRFFQGIPSPMAAALLAGLVWVFDDLGIDRELWLNVIAWFVTMYAGITMVTNVPFFSFKDFNLKKAVPFWVMLALVAGLAVVSLKPSVVLFLACLAYSLHGYVLWGMGTRVRRVPELP